MLIFVTLDASGSKSHAIQMQLSKRGNVPKLKLGNREAENYRPLSNRSPLCLPFRTLLMFETLDATRGKLPRIPTPPRKGGNPQAKAWELEREGSQAKAWEQRSRELSTLVQPEPSLSTISNIVNVRNARRKPW